MKTVLKNKLFLTTFVADMLSNFGDILYYMALMNYVLLLPNSQIAISAVTLSETLPMLFSFAIGIKADQTKDKFKLILATLILRTVLYGILGLFMGFEPQLWIVLAATGINFVSDLAGQYENGLYTPISLRVVAPEDRQDTAAFRQSVGTSLRLLFKASGAILIGLMSYQQLAFFNAATFAASALIMLAIKPKLTALLTADPIKMVDHPQEKKNILVDMWESSKLVIQEIKVIPVLNTMMIIVPIFNAIFSALDVLFLLAASESDDLILVNLPLTLTLISVSAMGGQILGGFLTMNLAKNWDVVKTLRLSMIFPAVMFASFLLKNIYLMLVVSFLAMMIIGTLGPKLQALILNSLPEERLATIRAGIDTYFTAGILLVRLLLSGLILVIAPTPLLVVFLVASLALAVYTFFGNSRADKV